MTASVAVTTHVDQATLVALRARAHAEHHTLEQEARIALARHLAQPERQR